MKGIAQIRSSLNDQVLGYIYFEENDQQTHIYGELEKLSPGSHGFHIHEKGDVRYCCDSLGSHYNPTNKLHSGRVLTDQNGTPFKDKNNKEYINFNRHVGDLSNLDVDKDGKVKFSFYDPLIKLSGNTSIIGRSVVIHADKDDLGKGNYEDSLTTGHSGKRIAYGIVGYL